MLGGNQLEVSAYTDADWGNDHDDRCSIGAYIIKVGGGAVSWKSKNRCFDLWRDDGQCWQSGHNGTCEESRFS